MDNEFENMLWTFVFLSLLALASAAFWLAV